MENQGLQRTLIAYDASGMPNMMRQPRRDRKTKPALPYPVRTACEAGLVGARLREGIRLWLCAAACILFAGFLACSREPERPEEWELEGGETLSSLSNDARPMVVLLLDPADWHACSNIIAEWLYWKQREGGNLRIVLTKHPRATARADGGVR